MKKIIFVLLFVLFTSSVSAQPLPVRLNHTIIIDTDCAIDDMRAISLLLARPEITIKAILVSDGSLSPGDGVEKISSLLSEFNNTDITVARGDVLEGNNPPWREFNMQISWGRETGIKMTELNAVDCLSEKLNSESEKIIIVCLGPLTDIAILINQNSALLSKIERIIWYNESVKPLKGFNYECNKEAADIVFKSGVRIEAISSLDKDEAFFDKAMLEVCRQSKYSACINPVQRSQSGGGIRKTGAESFQVIR